MLELRMKELVLSVSSGINRYITLIDQVEIHIYAE
jgi:hypothetical protein